MERVTRDTHLQLVCPPFHRLIIQLTHNPYLVMISESALSILLPPKGGSRVSKKDNIANLTPLAHKGGILTPMSAFGDQLITRLEDTGKFTFSSERIWGVYTP